MAVSDSSAWLSTSRPELAATMGGMDARVVRIEDAQIRLERTMGNAGLGVHGRVVEDGHAGGLAAGARGGGDGDQRLDRAGHGLAQADGRVDVGQQVGRIGGEEIGDLGRVDARSAAHGHVAVKLTVDREGDGVGKRAIGRLDAHPVVEHGVDAGLCQRGHGHGHRLKQRHPRDR